MSAATDFQSSLAAYGTPSLQLIGDLGSQGALTTEPAVTTGAINARSAFANIGTGYTLTAPITITGAASLQIVTRLDSSGFVIFLSDDSSSYLSFTNTANGRSIRVQASNGTQDDFVVTNVGAWMSVSVFYAADGTAQALLNGVRLARFAAITSPAFHLTTLGQYSGAFNFSGPVAFVRISGAVSDQIGIDRAVRQYYALNSSVRPQLVADGNSLVAGYGLVDPSTQSWPSQVAGLLPNWDVVNIGVSGQTTQQMSADAPIQIDLDLYGPERSVDVVSCLEGTNAAQQSGATTTNVYNGLVSYCQARRAKAQKALIFTIPPVGPTAPPIINTIAAGVNPMIRANWTTFADGIVDVAADSRLSDPTNGTYYQSDQTHWTTAGHAAVASLMASALPPLLITQRVVTLAGLTSKPFGF